MKILRIYFCIILSLSQFAFAMSEQDKPKQIDWPFDGVFGYFDQQAIQRGFQVYKEVCQVCHSLNYVNYRNLKEVGFSEEEIEAIAAEYQVTDGPNDQGEMFQRSAMLHDKFVAPYPNEQAARVANNGAYPPDLSLIINARSNGANYVYSILTGYMATIPKNLQLSPGMSYNPYFPNKQIAMPSPLINDGINYSDKTEASIDQMSKDVVIFLQWAADPKMEKRKLLGVKVILYLVVFTVIFYLAKRHVWRNIRM